MLGLAAAACAAPPGPRGWAGARPVTVGERDIVLAAHKSRLSALPMNSSSVLWQFPPRDREAYPLSERQRAALTEAVNSLEAADDVKAQLRQRVGDLTVSGPSIDEFKKAVDAAGLPEDARKSLTSQVDDATDDEERALKNVRALYGEIGISEDGETAFVPGFGGWVYALDTATGQTRWIHEAGAEIIGGVAVGDGDTATLYFGDRDGTVAALDAATGTTMWTFDGSGEVWATPTLADSSMYVTTLDGNLYKLDTEGRQQWVFSDAGAGIAAKPLVAGGSVYVGSFDKKLYAVDAESGSVRWSHGAGNWFWGAAAELDGTVYAASLDGKVYAVDAETGEERWAPRSTGSPVRSSPVLAGGGLIVAARDGEIIKLDPATGEPVGSPIETDSAVEADLTTDGDGNVFVVPRDPTLYIIDAGGDLAASRYPLPD